MCSSTSPRLITTSRATPADLPTIVAIEASATTAFAQIPALADLAHSSSDAATPGGNKAAEWLADGRVYLARRAGDPGQMLGFVAAMPWDAALYIAEISVRREAHGQGVGTALLEAVFEWARQRSAEGQQSSSIQSINNDDGAGEGSLAGGEGGDMPRKHRTATVSLMTYADVPWNGPWYRRRGFREVAAAEIGPAHVEIARSAEERELERPGFRRCCMLWEETTHI